MNDERLLQQRINDKAARQVQVLIARQPSPGETPSQRRIRIDKADADYPAAAAALTRMVLEPVAAQLSGVVQPATPNSPPPASGLRMERGQLRSRHSC